MSGHIEEPSSGCVPKFEGFATAAIHVGQEPEKWNSRAVNPPITMSTTYKQSGPGEHAGFEYSRSGNPTRNCFEECLAAMEGAKHGIVFASGLAASNTIMMMLKSGDHVVVMDDVYGGSNRLFSKVLTNFGLNFDFVDCRDVDLMEKHIQEDTTKLIWVETPTNPTMKIVDIEEVCKRAHKYPGVIVCVDNTFMSPYFQRPIMWGADMCFNSVTKYINGHSDTVMGSITCSDDALAEKLRFLQNAAGAVPSPFDCFLANRGCKTLHVRMERHQENAMAVARFLEMHPLVKRVLYPGLPSHPQHELVKKQCSGFSGMVAFEILGTLHTSRTFLQAVKVFTLAESLGGFESLVELPAVMTHASVDAEDRVKLGISDTFIRLSVGLESVEDLLKDLNDALMEAAKQT